MFRFEHPHWLWALSLVPIIWLVELALSFWRRRALKAAFSVAMLESLMPLRSTAKHWIKTTLLSLATAFLVLAIANPQFGSKTEEVKRKGVDVMVALDVSNSMMAEDLYPNRIERAKRAVQDLLGHMKADRMGIVVFAGEAFVQLPITTDLGAARMFLASINTGLVGTQGTDVAQAIDLCVKAFDEESATSKVIVVISDGESHESDAGAAAAQAAAKGIVVHTIGMGSAAGAPIPVYENGQRVGFRKSKEGETVVSKLDEGMLGRVASSGAGVFVRATNAESGMDYVFEQIDKMDKVEYGTMVYTDFENRFHFALFPALLLLFIELIIPNRRTLWWQKLVASRPSKS